MFRAVVIGYTGFFENTDERGAEQEAYHISHPAYTTLLRISVTKNREDTMTLTPCSVPGPGQTTLLRGP